jgi:hypothetical protein
MSECTFLISQIPVTEPVINDAIGGIGICRIAITVALVVTIATVTVAAVTVAAVAVATTKQPAEGVKNGGQAGTGGRCHSAKQSDRQKQSSDAESHTGSLGVTETGKDATGDHANAGEKACRREVRFEDVKRQSALRKLEID